MEIIDGIILECLEWVSTKLPEASSTDDEEFFKEEYPLP